MDFINILVFVIAIGVAVFIFFDKKKSKSHIEKVIVCYSEVVGNKVIEHDKQYLGLLDKKNDVFRIADLHLTLPIAPVDVFIYTKSGNSKIYLIKMGQFRYGFRIPSMHNQVYVQTRDAQGNPIKLKGKPQLKKFKWKFCDDVVEPDVKHWEQNVMEKIKAKHKTKAEMWNKWIAPIIVGMIFITGIVTINMLVKFVNQSLDRQMEIAGEITVKAEENTGLINNLIKKVEPQASGETG